MVRLVEVVLEPGKRAAGGLTPLQGTQASRLRAIYPYSLSVPLCHDTLLQRFLSKRIDTLTLHLRSQRQLLVQFRSNSKIEPA